MRKIFGILFALVLVVSLGLATAAPVMADSREISPGWTDIVQVAAGGEHTVGLKSDGTVVAVGSSGSQLSVGSWTDIVQVAAYDYHTVGLESDGTVLDTEHHVGGWTDIVQVAAGGYHTVGLESDGTVVAGGDNNDGQCDVGGWTNIAQVAGGAWHTVGVRVGGTVVATGWDYYGQCHVSGWTGITQVGAGARHTVGLKDDGSVVAVGESDDGQCNVDEWTSITQVAAGAFHTVGLKSDGTVVDTKYDVSGWGDIIQVAAGGFHTVGVRSDGTVIAVGNNDYGQCGNIVTQTIDGYGIVNAIAEADMAVVVNGNATVTIFKYDSNPHADELMEGEGEPASLGLLVEEPWEELGIWRDVSTANITPETELEIRMYYTHAQAEGFNEDMLRIFWHNGSDWVQCSPTLGYSSVNKTDVTINGTLYSGYMWATINQGTTPSPPLTGDEFGGYGHPSEVNGPCGMATLADVTPFALVSVGIVAVWATKRKGKVS